MTFWLIDFTMIVQVAAVKSEVVFQYKLQWRRGLDSNHSMDMSLRKIEEFNLLMETWIEYQERLLFLFTANNTKNAEKKRAMFLTMVGVAMYKLSKSLLAPVKPDEVI